MGSSYPSKRIAVADMPEVKQFSGKFVYNFFTTDERSNDAGTSTSSEMRRAGAVSFDTETLDSVNFQRFTPRFIQLQWNTTVDRTKSYLSSRVNIAEHLLTIHNEQSFTSDDFTNIIFQDQGYDLKLRFFVKRAIEVLRSRQSPDSPESQFDIVRWLNERTSPEVSPSFLTAAFMSFADRGYRFLDPDGNELLTESLLDRLKTFKVRAQINNKAIHHLLKTTSENVINIFDDDTRSMLDRAKSIQTTAKTSRSSALIDGRDYDFEVLDFVGYRKVHGSTFDSSAQVIGYIVDKKEIPRTGPAIPHDSIVVESPFAHTTADLKVKYGSRYEYAIRSIGLVEIQVKDLATSSVVALSFLLSSRPSTRVVIDTVENVAPPPPADINIAWDFRKSAARILWGFPVNTQRDIKQFQIFRRKTISEPFEMIKQFNFDDSEIQTPNPRSIDRLLIERLSSPKNFFYDREFTKDSRFIYALSSIDAHGLVSNYSIQMECWFDRFQNRMKKKLISVQGAPMALPNMFLNQDTFVDSIRTSGHKKVRIIFNPEYLSIVNKDKHKVPFLKTGENDQYKLSMINVDLQEQQSIAINLEDNRTTSEKNK